MNIKIKIKMIAAALAAVFVVTAPVAYVSAADGDYKAYNWYCVGNDKHLPPPVDVSMSFIEQYDGYYLNQKAKGEKVIYLTFDAGYTNGNVELVLDALKKHDAKGAFFILDNLIKRNPELVKRMVDEGHLVCNHTRSHPDMTKITDRDMFEHQLKTLSDAYLELIGSEMPKVYRPPEGRFSRDNLRLAKELGYKTVFWSFAYADWDNNRQPDPDAAMKKILSHTHPGEIMLLHPTSATNAKILDELLSKLEAEGYRFGSLEELWT